jgi:hypothetical protein
MSRPEIRVHPEEGWIAVRDRPDSDRPWAKMVPAISLTDDDVTDWARYEATDTLTELRTALDRWECLAELTSELTNPEALAFRNDAQTMLLVIRDIFDIVGR